MSDLACCLVRIAYAYTCLLGLKNFEMDFNTGETWTTRSGTIFAALMNILLLSLLPIQIFLYDSSMLRGKVLYQYVFMLMSMIRVVGVFAILLLGWLRRCQMRALVGQVVKLIVKRPQMKDIIRSRVLWKIICSFFTEVLHIYVAYLLDIKVNATYAFILIGISSSIINVLTSQLSLITLIVRTQYKLLNEDLSAILDEIHTPHQPLYRYYNLAQRINNITRMQHHLRILMQRIFKIFEFQGFCVVSIYFLSSIASIHFIYSAYQYGHDSMSLSLFNLIMVFIFGSFYHSDGCFNVFIIFHLLDTRAEMMSLIANRIHFPLELDKRIDAAIENLQLQLACQPLKFSVMGLFDLDQSTAVIVGNALIINAIFLIQYDFAHYTDKF